MECVEVCLREKKRERRRPHGTPSGVAAPSSSASIPTLLCRCGDEVAVRMVKKEGPNRGRRFFCCAQLQRRRCGFFEWHADDPACHVEPTLSVAQRLIAALRTAHGCGRGDISLSMAEWYLDRAEGSKEDAFYLYMLANYRVVVNSNAMHPSAPISTGIGMDLITPKLMVPALSMLQKRHAGVCSSNIQ